MKLGVFGLGNMGTAIISGIIRGELVSHKEIWGFDTDKAKMAATKEALKIHCDDPRNVCKHSDLLILAVKPQDSHNLLREIKEYLSHQVLLSICAGISIDSIVEDIGSDKKIARGMPNTPLLVGEGATCIAFNSHVTQEEREFTLKTLRSLGMAFEVDEKLMDAVTGLSGSGPAYVFMFIEALADGGVKAGLPRDLALSLAAQTVLGSSRLLLESGKHPGELKDMVTSPSGTTIEGVSILEKAAFRGGIIDAVYQASQRSVEMRQNH